MIFSLDGFRPFGWYLTLIQFAYYSIFGWFECQMKGITRRIPIATYLLLAFLTLGTMGFSNSSLGYLNYPTQVIANFIYNIFYCLLNSFNEKSLKRIILL